MKNFASMGEMVTIKQIRGGRDYFKNHLSSNDYYSENETTIGHWRGSLAKMLGIEGMEVNARVFESLRNNKHPFSGEKLRQRTAKVSFHDVVISAPKSYSIVAVVGGDERLVEGFKEAAATAFERLEKYASARDRSGESYHTEKMIRTGNVAAAVFYHDTSRMLDPQQHCHYVISNHTMVKERGSYFALQPKVMMDEAASWITDQFHKDLGKVAEEAGYSITMKNNRLQLDVGMNLEYKFSKRAQQRKQFEQRYQKLFGREPDKKRVTQFIQEGRGVAYQRFKDEYKLEFGSYPSKSQIEDFVKDWRSARMATSSKEEVRNSQRSGLTEAEADKLDHMVEQARRRSHLRENQTDKLREAYQASQKESMKKDDVVQQNSSLGASLEKKKRNKKRQKKNIIEQTEAIRRMRRGVAFARVLQGHPAFQVLIGLKNRQRKQNYESGRKQRML